MDTFAKFGTIFLIIIAVVIFSFLWYFNAYNPFKWTKCEQDTFIFSMLVSGILTVIGGIAMVIAS